MSSANVSVSETPDAAVRLAPMPDVDAKDVVKVLSPTGEFGPPGSQLPSGQPGFTTEQVQQLHVAMVRCRYVDRYLERLGASGQIGFHVSGAGEEASVIGVAHAMRPQDWLFPGLRDLGAVLHRGMPISAYVDHAFGNQRDRAKGRQMPGHFTWREGHVMSVGSAFGNQTTQAVGFAWAAKMKNDDVVALTTMGEGETSGGEFHNALNFAGVFCTPTVFVVRHNFAASDRDRGVGNGQTAAETFAEKAIAYGLPSIRVDGNDILAVTSVTREAIARAARGEGATLIEALTTRADEQSPAWRTVDPLARTRAFLTIHAGWTDDRERQLEASVDAELKEAVAQAASAPSPSLESMFEDVFETPPQHLVEQRDALLAGPRYGSK